MVQIDLLPSYLSLWLRRRRKEERIEEKNKIEYYY